MWNPQLEQHLLDFDKQDDANGEAIEGPRKPKDEREETAPIDNQKSKLQLTLPLVTFAMGYLVHLMGPSSLLQLFLTICTIAISAKAVSGIGQSFGPVQMDDSSIHSKDRIEKKMMLIDDNCTHQVRLDRTSIARHLGKLGAPPLPMDNDAVDILSHLDCEAKGRLQQDLEKFLSHYAELVGRVEQQLEMIQVAIRLQFGLGISTTNSAGGVDRIERAMLSRQLRKKNRNGNLVLSLGTVRKRLHQVLIQQCAYLESLLFRHGGDNEGRARVTVNGNGPITLTTLRHCKVRLLELLSIVSGNFVDDPTNENWDQLRQCGALALESTAYMETWPTMSRANSDSLVAEESNFDVNSLLVLVQGLQTALLALDEIDENEEEKWWQRVVAMTKGLAATIEHRNDEYYRQHMDSVHGMGQDTSKNDHHIDQAPTSEKGEFSSEAIENHPRIKEQGPEERAFPESKQKVNQTFIFATGKGDADDDFTSDTQSRPKTLTDFMDPEEKMLAELENRLHSMPLTEEITVTEHKLSDQDQTRPKTRAAHSSTTEKSQVMFMMAPGKATMQFQGELAASLACFTAQNDKHGSEKDSLVG